MLDENLPRRLTPLLAPEVEAVTVAQQVWRGKQNGELIALAEREFDAVATIDRGIPHRQNVGGVDLAILLFEAMAVFVNGLRFSRSCGHYPLK